MATFYNPAKGLRVYLAGMLRRWNCGRRFGHFPTGDGFAGYRACARCGAYLL